MITDFDTCYVGIAVFGGDHKGSPYIGLFEEFYFSFYDAANVMRVMPVIQGKIDNLEQFKKPKTYIQLQN
jgi:hypothetical protein